MLSKLTAGINWDGWRGGRDDDDDRVDGAYRDVSRWRKRVLWRRCFAGHEGTMVIMED